MAVAKKKRVRKSKKQPVNRIDKAVGGIRKFGSNVKKQVTGSKEVKSVKKSLRSTADKVNKKVRPKAAAAAKTTTDVIDSGKGKIKSALGGSAASANERIRARSAGPQQTTPLRDAKTTTPGDRDAGDRRAPPKETAGNRAQTRADIERGGTRPEKAAPKQSLKRRALNKTGRGLMKIRAPHAMALGAGEQVINAFGGNETGAGAADELLTSTRNAVTNAPTSIREGAREFVNRPVKSTASALAAIPDSLFNTSLAAGNAFNAATAAGNSSIELTDPAAEDKLRQERSTNAFNESRDMTDSVFRNPVGRLVDSIFGDGQQPTGEAAAAGAATPPLQPEETPPAGSGSGATKVGLKGAVSNREFLADKARGFRTGLDEMQAAGFEKQDNPNANLAAFGAATGIAAQRNKTEQASRNLNIDEATARSNIENNTAQTGLRRAQTRGANSKADFSVPERMDAVQERSQEILKQASDFKEQATGGFFDDDQAAGDLKNLQDSVFNAAFNSGFKRDSGASSAAGQMVTDEITPLMQGGVIDRVMSAISSSDVSAADILTDTGDLAVNAETVNMMAVGGEEGDTVFMTIPRQGGQTETIPLFELNEIEDPNIRSHFAKMLGSGQGQQTLRDANQ